MALQPDQIIINRYRIVQLLGQGGFGAVYRAWDQNLNHNCAIKENLNVSPEAQRQFNREATVLANLSHPSLPRVTDYFTITGEGQYLVMDFIEGDDLASLMQQRGMMPLNQVMPWINQVLDALAYLHGRQPPVVHRDIKPANIRITPEGRAVLVDFGLVKIYDPSTRTTIGARAVTPGFAPPEQYGTGSTDPRSDIYAMGATIYTLLTGQEPMESIRRMMMGGQMRTVHQINPQVPLGVSQAIERAMALEPPQRFQSAMEFKAALNAPGGGVLVSAGVEAPARAPAEPYMHPPPASIARPAPVAPAPRPSMAGPAAVYPPATYPPAVQTNIPQKKRGAAYGAGIAIVLVLCLGALLATSLWFTNSRRNAQSTASARTTQTLQMQSTQTQLAILMATQVAQGGYVSTPGIGLTLLFAPMNGGLVHNPGNGGMEAFGASVNTQDFVVEARFFNPYSSNEGSWDYGFIFRHTGENNHFRLILQSDKTWQLINNTGSAEGKSISQGKVTWLNTDSNGSNTVRLIAHGSNGEFYVNSRLVAKLDLSERINSGNIFIVTGFYQGNETSGSTTRFENFQVWGLP